MSSGRPGSPLRGQVACVTGASRGLGREVAIELAKRGADVAVIARTGARLNETAELVTASGRRAMPITADVRDERAIATAISAVTAELGDIDVLVNNAGSLSCIGPLWQADPSVWWHDVEVSLLGTFHLCRAVLPSMVDRGSGRVVNLAGGGAFSPLPNLSGYACGKAAILRLTDTLAQEVGGSGPCVFSVSPGPLATEMGAYLRESDGGRRWLPALQAVEMGEPHRVAELIARLAAGEADELTGRCISIDDDLANLVAHSARIREQDRYTLRFARL